jgi:ADP-ribose pyrophosphatase YjhB (NUDIX family)
MAQTPKARFADGESIVVETPTGQRFAILRKPPAPTQLALPGGCVSFFPGGFVDIDEPKVAPREIR